MARLAAALLVVLPLVSPGCAGSARTIDLHTLVTTNERVGFKSLAVYSSARASQRAAKTFGIPALAEHVEDYDLVFTKRPLRSIVVISATTHPNAALAHRFARSVALLRNRC